MPRSEPSYPFEPKSGAYLRPGQFWAVPLSDGHFAAGRILQLGGYRVADTRSFFGGLHDWVGTHEPRADDLSGRRLVECGQMHINAIRMTGGRILGHRDLADDGIELPLSLSALGGTDVVVLKGSTLLREANAADFGHLPLFSGWGPLTILSLAEQLRRSRSAV